MNAATRRHEELGHLSAYLDAVTDDSPADTDAASAQERLLDRITRAHVRTPVIAPAIRWRWAAAACVLALVVTAIVPFVPGGRDGVAFAEVQRRFETFETMRATIVTEAGGRVGMETNLVMDAEGRARLDAGDMFSYVIDPRTGMMLQLFHHSRTAARIDFGRGAGVPDAARLEWLEEIRDFQGTAVELSQTRVIDGRSVHGFRLDAGGMNMTLWATEEGEPVRLEIRHGKDDPPLSATQMDLRFDEPVAPGTFSLTPPAGYTLMQGGPDAG